MTTEERKEQILMEIDKLYGDTTVPFYEILDFLQEIRDQLVGLINCLEDEYE